MKKITAIIFVLMLLLSLAACSSEKKVIETSSSSSESTEVEESSADESSSTNLYAAFQDEANSMAESSDAEAAGSSTVTVKNEYDTVYLAWTYSNWESASDADRKKCAQSYLGYLGDMLGLAVTPEDQSDEQIEKIETSLETALKNNTDFTVKEIVIYTLADEDDPDNQAVSED